MKYTKCEGLSRLNNRHSIHFSGRIIYWNANFCLFSLASPLLAGHFNQVVRFCDSLGSRDGEGNGTPLQYSCLENPMDGGAWKAAVHGVTEGRTRLSDFTFTFHFYALEKEMATHSSVLAWRSQWWGSLVGCRLWGRTESDMTEATQQQQQGSRESRGSCLWSLVKHREPKICIIYKGFFLLLPHAGTHTVYAGTRAGLHLRSFLK